MSFIASVVYPDVDPTTAKKRVRERIRDAVKRKGVVKMQGKRFAAAPFFTWACRNRDWSALRAVNGLPREPFAVTVTEEISMSDEVRGFSIPSDPVSLKQAYLDCIEENSKLEEENRQLRAQLAELERECEDWRQKDEHRRLKNLKSGRRGNWG